MLIGTWELPNCLNDIKLAMRNKSCYIISGHEFNFTKFNLLNYYLLFIKIKFTKFIKFSLTTWNL